MSENTLELGMHRDLVQQAYISGKLAQDEKGFTALHQAFRSGGAGAVQQALRR